VDPIYQIIIAVFSSVLASSGLWAYLLKRSEKKDGKTKLLLGIAHDRIIYLGMLYIDRGYVTKDEFENLETYLYTPYRELGGNGTASRVMEGVQKLPIKRSFPKKEEENKNE
jgi:hypothetical protein